MTQLDRAVAAYRAKDYATARKLSALLAEQGDSHARYLLGLMHSAGQGGRSDPAEAFRHYRTAAEAGHVVAQYCLAALYAQGRGVRQDYAAALRWYREAAEGGDADAFFKVGVMYANGQGMPVDFAEARRWWARAAEQRHGEAMLFIGHLLRHGDGCAPDPAAAAEWYLKAWQVDNPQAQGCALALVPELERLADGGAAAAQNILAVVHKFLTGNEAETLRRLNQAAAQGHAEALRLLAYCYEHGEGVKQDAARAAELYRRAAEQGDKFAQFNLAVFYADGRGGLPADVDEAIHWYRKAADQGVTEALQPLAELLARRNRDRDDANEAIQRLHMAAAAGAEDAEYRLVSGDGQWSVVMTNRGEVVTLKGITLDELSQPSPGAEGPRH
jgi:TPR repeat protein